ncbi:MAG: hypothetical protein AAF770_00145 [Bacteroidota bacterium]
MLLYQVFVKKNFSLLLALVYLSFYLRSSDARYNFYQDRNIHRPVNFYREFSDKKQRKNMKIRKQRQAINTILLVSITTFIVSTIIVIIEILNKNNHQLIQNLNILSNKDNTASLPVPKPLPEQKLEINNIEVDGKIVNLEEYIQVKLNTHVTKEDSSLLHIHINKKYLLAQLRLRSFFRKNGKIARRTVNNLEFLISIDKSSNIRVRFASLQINFKGILEKTSPESENFIFKLRVFRAAQQESIIKDASQNNKLVINLTVRQYTSSARGVNVRAINNKTFLIKFNDSNNLIANHIQKVEDEKKQEMQNKTTSCIHCNEEYDDQATKCPNCWAPNTNVSCTICLDNIYGKFEDKPEYQACRFPGNNPDCSHLFCRDCIIKKNSEGNLKFIDGIGCKCPVCRSGLLHNYQGQSKETNKLIEDLMIKKIS